MASSLFGTPVNQPAGAIPAPNNLSQIKSMMQMMQASNNPQAMLGTLMNQNPQMQQVMQLVNQYGDPKTAFFETAKVRGVDPNQIINMLK